MQWFLSFSLSFILCRMRLACMSPQWIRFFFCSSLNVFLSLMLCVPLGSYLSLALLHNSYVLKPYLIHPLIWIIETLLSSSQSLPSLASLCWYTSVKNCHFIFSTWSHLPVMMLIVCAMQKAWLTVLPALLGYFSCWLWPLQYTSESNKLLLPSGHWNICRWKTVL